MKRKNAKDLIERAKKYMGHDISIKILDQKGNLKETVTSRFSDWAAVSLMEIEGKPDVKLYAKLIDNTHSDITYCPPLKSVVEEFERLGKANSLRAIKVGDVSELKISEADRL